MIVRIIIEILTITIILLSTSWASSDSKKASKIQPKKSYLTQTKVPKADKFSVIEQKSANNRKLCTETEKKQDKKHIEQCENHVKQESNKLSKECNLEKDNEKRKCEMIEEMNDRKGGCLKKNSKDVKNETEKDKE